MTYWEFIVEYRALVAFFALCCTAGFIVAAKASDVSTDSLLNDGFTIEASPQAGIVFILCLVLFVIFTGGSFSFGL